MVDIDSTIYLIDREQEEQHTQERAKKLGIPYINLSEYPLLKEILDLIPEQMALKYEIAPYLKIGRDLKVAVVNPQDESLRQFVKEMQDKTGLHFAPSLISESSFRHALYYYEKFRQEGLKKSEEAETAKQTEKRNISDIKSAAEYAKRATTTELLGVLLHGAIALSASDIHIEPGDSDFLTRYRIDGVLQDVIRLPYSQYRQLVSRIKFLASLRMDIADKPQDGRFSFEVLGEREDFRVSMMPSARGETVVMRLLGKEQSLLHLDALGFRPEMVAAVKDAVAKPHGMILTSGPTGAGKSTTLYAVLESLKRPGIKIITLEDPVEYRVENVSQSQIKEGAGYNFAEALRASLRQDPDVLMVGEIRDVETAEIAIQAALTGHLLLSTIHANSAPAVFVRLLEIGVRPFLLAGSVNLIMAQRLVRRICSSCREEYSPAPDVWKTIVEKLTPIKDRLPQEVAEKLDSKSPKLVRSHGCAKCNQTGFAGRIVAAEYIKPEEKIESLVARAASIAEFEKVAVTGLKMMTMEQDGLAKVLQGLTTPEEVWRVTRE